MPKRLDLTGNIYGELTVIEMLYGYKMSNTSKARTYCRCGSKNCKNNNIELLRLPYTYSKDDIKNEILNILSPVTITA